MMGCKTEVWYLAHSGFALRLDDTFLIFDYYLDTCDHLERALASGVIDPEEIKDSKVLIFSSHKHPDHFNPIILDWKEKLPHSKYFLSSDIPKKYRYPWIHLMKPHEVYEDGAVKVQTFKSTDEGVAFLVTLDCIRIYHAGDLNWWHWDEEPKDRNGDMAARFKQEVSLIQPYQPIDIAFLTADPRQEQAALWGMTFFLEQINVKAAFPMHFWEDYSINGLIHKASADHPQLKKVKNISARGQLFTLDLK